MTSWRVGVVLVELMIGDIAAQAGFDAVVNAANAELRPGGGVAGALHRAAGPGLDRECRSLAPIRPGEAVLTGGHGLPNRRVVHCLGPVWGRDEPAAGLLAACYRNALRLADGDRVESIAFPALSTGAFGYPQDDAARVALATVLDAAQTLTSVRRIRFVLYDAGSLESHEAALAELTAAGPDAAGEAHATGR
jgi:O-acetyl-ADP-ribose deacetylase